MGLTGLGLTGLGLAGCSADAPGQLALAVDPAGRLVAIVALCPNQFLGTLTLTDETTGTSVTVRPEDSPEFGATIILTGPVGDPRPEGVLELLDRRHDYALSGTTTGTDPDEQTGTLGPVRFRLGSVVTEERLRTGAVLATADAGAEQSAALIEKAAFLDRAMTQC